MKFAGAIFDSAKIYRYVLWRKWKKNAKMVMYIGLNPSKAHADKNDNTITKLIKITKHNGYDGFYMLNLFALISTDPDNLLNQCVSTIGRRNNAYLHHYAGRSKKIIFCWGSFWQAYEPIDGKNCRADQVAAMFPERMCLDHNSNGRPKHPLYCLDKTEYKLW
jgi:hypothetical protein